MDYDNFQTFEFSFNNSRKLWHNFKFRNFVFLNLFQISKKIFDNYQKYKQIWWKLAINYHFQISYNEPNYFKIWRTRLNVEHENQETEICGWIWMWKIGKDNWMVENAYLRISHTLHTFWIPQTLPSAVATTSHKLLQNMQAMTLIVPSSESWSVPLQLHILVSGHIEHCYSYIFQYVKLKYQRNFSW